ncbi:hypothetical protein U3516DRAFT_832098 [Neocallimastix sp. 'constans']
MLPFNKIEDKLNINKCYDLLQKSIFLLFYDLVYRNEYFVKILFAPRIEEYPDAPINIHLSIIPEDSPLMQASTVNECIGNFLSFSSFLFCKIDDENDILFIHSIFLILTCLCQNNISLSNITNPKQTKDVYIYKRKNGNQDNKIIACHILDLIAVFIENNLNKKELFECYYQALLIIQKILFYLTYMKIPFEYQWNEIYKSLFLIISYITKNLDSLKNEILLKSIINMLTKTISFILINGKIFMNEMREYDLLIKEIIENKEECQKLKSIRTKLEGLSSSENLTNLNEYLEEKVFIYFKPIDMVIEYFNDYDSNKNITILIKNYTDNVEFSIKIDPIETYHENPNKRIFFVRFNKLIISYLKLMIENDTSLDDFVPSLTGSSSAKLF